MKLTCCVSTVLFLAFAFPGAEAHAQQGTCFGTLYGSNKTNALSRSLNGAVSTKKRDEIPGSVITMSQKLPDIPLEVDRIQRGYKEGIVSAYPGASPYSEWLGIDLDRHMAYRISRYEFDSSDAGVKAIKSLDLNRVAWARKWVDGKHVEIEEVRALSQNVGASNFGSFICSANALWASTAPSKALAGMTDAAMVLSLIVDVSKDGRTGFSKRVELGDPVSDSAESIKSSIR